MFIINSKKCDLHNFCYNIIIEEGVCNLKMNDIAISHVQDYIELVSKIVDSKDTEKFIVTYRGECKEYSTPCVPNIYREDYLRNYDFFEKNIFDEMRANKISKGENYLENAISAQHDGFPSRLLDVSYNSLVALYFAITPYYRLKENEYDEENGKVFVFFIDKLFCPTGDNITKAYENIICQKSTFINNAVFSKNHKLIDHLKINNRIIAQQGAFILFQGNDVDCLPKYMYEEILIPANAKKTLRKELKNFFGIHTGSIYPEAENLIEEIKKKSLSIENSNFDLDSELKILMCNLENEIKYYLFQIFNNAKKSQELIRCFEKMLRGYQLGIMQLKDDNPELAKKISLCIKAYNEMIEDAFNDIDIYFKGTVQTSKNFLKLKDEQNEEKD